MQCLVGGVVLQLGLNARRLLSAFRNLVVRGPHGLGMGRNSAAHFARSGSIGKRPAASNRNWHICPLRFASLCSPLFTGTLYCRLVSVSLLD